MSKIRHPQEKKALSYKHDRRYAFGGARWSRRQLGFIKDRRRWRHNCNRVLFQFQRFQNEKDIEDALAVISDARRHTSSFWKFPSISLGEFLKRRKTRELLHPKI